uniref:Disease resistance R13L4/SHOC-2-like LRR domain-containing protein n=1 Tax=Fagus sylvatica TaxID=28930 RepID=A0A2N9GCY5_FAGSY
MEKGAESEENEVFLRLGPLSKADAGILLQERVKESVSDHERFKISIEGIADKSKSLPAAVVVLIAGALNHSGEHDSAVLKLESALEEAASHEEADKCIRSLVHYGYDMLLSGDKALTTGKDATDMALANCCWHSRQFFLKRAGVYYNELIVNWILEGYIGHVDQVEKAYEDGHRVLMKLIDRGMLKMQEDNFVIMEGLALEVPDCCRDGYIRTASLGLASLYEDGDSRGLGMVIPTDRMIKTLCNREACDKVSTLLIDGSRLYVEGPDTFFQPMQGIQDLAIFNPRFKLLPSSLSKMQKLRMLVLRGCDELQKIDNIQELKSLTVLEISGASNLEVIPDVLFEQMIHLQSLNFSAVPIKSLPSSFSKLSELRWLILRKCSCLEKLPKLQAHKNLEVIDLSGAISLKTIEEENLSSLQKLQKLDLSHTQIDQLPILDKLEKFTQLLLKGCKFTGLSILKYLPALQILDLSGSITLKEIDDFSENKNDLKILHLSKTIIFHLPSSVSNLQNLELLDLSDACNLVEIPENAFREMRYLRHLNLSNTNIEKLPSLSKLGNLRELFLRHCPMKKLPKTEGLTRLQELDLSNASSLVDFQDKSFEHLAYLRYLNFSNTKIKILPSIANLKNLRKVLLHNCGELTEFSLSKGLEKLEELDLSGCTALKEIEANLLENMLHLRSLNLSGTSLKSPHMSNLINLIELSLRGCKLSDSEPDLGKCTKLEVLDLSETDIQSLPSLDKFGNLRDLKLRWLFKIREAAESEITYSFGNLNGVLSLDWEKIKHLPEELNWDQCGIFKHIKNRPCMSVSGTKIFKNLKEEPGLWDTCFKEFQFSVCALEKEDRARDIWWHRADPNFRKIYFQTHSFPKTIGRYLEILGFDKFPEDVDDVLMKAKYVSLIEDKFVTCLSDLRMGNVNAMKGCWLERCVKMETILSGAEMEKNLTILWASNLPELKSVFSEGMQSGSLANLTELYLHCCPMIEVVFSSSLLPENLKILQIKFCDELKTLFKPTESKECKLRELEKLHLVELPKLIRMWMPLENLSDIFPSLPEIKIKECPKLENLQTILEFPRRSVENSEIEEYH